MDTDYLIQKLLGKSIQKLITNTNQNDDFIFVGREELDLCNESMIDRYFKDNSFDVVLSLAVLEHVKNPWIHANEMIRVLKPGGFFIASYDFWPTKVDVMGKRFFGLPWIIFDDNAVSEMDKFATNYSMEKLKATEPFNLTEPIIKLDGLGYTFAMSIYQKQ